MKAPFNVWFCYFPILGMFTYVIIFSISAWGYPGGSFNFPNAAEYSFYHNFLCDVMNPITPSGVTNPARAVAVSSHFVLSATMLAFFYILPEVFSKQNRFTQIVRYFGVLAMLVFLFMFTSHHDTVVTLTGILGSVALVPFFMELRSFKNLGFRFIAYTSFVLSIIVYIGFETKVGYYYLPFLQKITFILDAIWVIWTCEIVRKKLEINQKISRADIFPVQG